MLIVFGPGVTVFGRLQDGVEDSGNVNSGVLGASQAVYFGNAAEPLNAESLLWTLPVKLEPWCETGRHRGRVNTCFALLSG